jgi:hypothetical protein
MHDECASDIVRKGPSSLVIKRSSPQGEKVSKDDEGEEEEEEKI